MLSEILPGPLLAQGRILIGPVWIICLSLGQSVEAKGGGHIYCSHLHPIQSLLVFCGPHNTHHKPNSFSLLIMSIICLPAMSTPLHPQYQNDTLIHKSFSINSSKLMHNKPSQKSSHMQNSLVIKNHALALAGVSKWIEHQPANQTVAGSIPSQGTCLGCRPGPQ